MSKLLIYDNDAAFLRKLNSVISASGSFDDIDLANDESTCISKLKNTKYDLLILKINNTDFRDNLIKAQPDIVNMSLLCTDADTALVGFNNFSQMNFYHNCFSIVDLFAAISVIMGKEDKAEESTEPLVDYVAIKLDILRKLEKFSCDVYVKLSQVKYVKIVNQGTEVTLAFFEKYSSKKIEELYITKPDFYKYSDELFAQKFSRPENFERKTDYYSNSVATIKELVSDLGISENVVALANELVDDAISEYKDPSLAALLDQFRYSKDRYIYDHSMLTSIFATAMCEKLEWKNRQVSQKVAFAAIFHDFGFTDHKLAYLDPDGKNKLELTKDQKHQIFYHGEIMAQKLALNKNISSEVLGMVAKHHEGRGEASYPNGLGSGSLSILECLFVVAHEFTNELYKIAFRQDKVQQAIDKVLVFSNTGNFRQVRQVFIDVVASKYQEKK